MAKAIKTKDKPQIVEVEWTDSHSEAGWRSTKDALEGAEKATKTNCFTAGYLIASTSKYLLLSLSYTPWPDDTHEVSETMQTPRVAIINIKGLKTGEIIDP